MNWVVRAYLSQAELLATIIAALTVVELAFPRPRFGLVSRLRGCIFVLLSLGAFAASLWVFVAVQRTLPVQPLIVLSSAPLIVQIVVAYLGQDFLYYWLHRLQHCLPLLWRFHAAHHSIAELSAANSFHHWSEDILHFAFVNLPLWLLMGIDPAAAAITTLLIAVSGYFIHAASRLNLGPLRRGIADNRFHRIHHSLEPRHWNRNFGAFSTIWDQAFGTAYFPRTGENPATGLRDVVGPRNIKEYLSWGLTDAHTG